GRRGRLDARHHLQLRQAPARPASAEWQRQKTLTGGSWSSGRRAARAPRSCHACSVMGSRSARSRVTRCWRARNSAMPSTSFGVTRRSIGSLVLNLIKGRTLVWRRRAEEQIRASGLDYTIIRCGVLTNAPPGNHAVEISRRDYPLAPWYRIGRADAAEVFVQALQHAATRRTTFDAIWSRQPGPTDWNAAFSRLLPDDRYPS